MAELKALNKQLKGSVKELGAKVKTLSEAGRRLRRPLQTVSLVQGVLADPGRDMNRRRESGRLKRAIATASRILDKLEDVGQAAPDDRKTAPKAAWPPSAPSDRSAPIADAARRSQSPRTRPAAPTIYLVDNDPASRQAILPFLQEAGYVVKNFTHAAKFIKAYRPGGEGCIVVNSLLPDMDGFKLIEQLRAGNPRLPAIIVTGHGDAQTALGAIRAGAADFIERPIYGAELLATIKRVLDHSPDTAEILVRREAAAAKVAALSPRERQILALVLEGHPSKNIAADLGISQRTVENHRAAIMRKMGAKSLAQLVRLVLATE